MAADACAADLIFDGSADFGPRYSFTSLLSYTESLVAGSADDILILSVSGYRDESSGTDPDLSVTIVSSGWTVLSDQTLSEPFGSAPRHLIARQVTAWRRRGSATDISVDYGAGYADASGGAPTQVAVIVNAPLLPSPAVPAGVLTAPTFPSGDLPFTAKTSGEDCLAVALGAGGSAGITLDPGWDVNIVTASGRSVQFAWKWFGASDVIVDPAGVSPGTVNGSGVALATTFLIASHSCDWPPGNGFYAGQVLGSA